MIFVDRTRVNIPDILVNPAGAGARETTEAISHYSGPNNHQVFNKYKVYSHSTVKDALIDLFHGKCAYCESNTLHVYSGDVEHFRPKGEITGANPDRPGYYWLAANWDNLLLSCRNCNQKLSHHIYGAAQRKTMGKMNQFPLSDESRRVRNHTGNIANEESVRLILNPCVDNPENHLEYDETHAVIRPKNINGRESELGKNSIEVYVLQRSYLVHAREKLLVEILAQIQRVKEAIANYNDHVNDLNNAKKFYFEKIMSRELQHLKKFLNPKAEYVGMARQIIGKFLHQFSISL